MPKTKTIAFLALTPVPELDLFGPIEIFKTANLMGQNYEIILLSGSESKKLVGASGIAMKATAFCHEFRRPIDTLVVIGDPKSTADVDAKLKKWLQKKAKSCRRICSVCTGAFILAEAEILNGKKMTTHWLYEKSFRKRYPKAHLDISAIWIKDDNVYTSAGVSTGIDLALALVEEDCGTRLSLKIAKSLVLFLRRSGKQNQFSQTMLAQEKVKGRFQDFPEWLLENLHLRLSVDQMAEHLGMSPRHFSRQFAESFQTSPGDYVRNMKVEKAKEQLSSTDADWLQIAQACGMESEALRRAFVREMGISPNQYRIRNR